MAARRVLKAVLVDLSGTLHIEDSAVPGSQEALKRLRNAPLAIRFVTNTTKESKRDLLERLKKLEFDIAEDEIFTSLTAARNLLEQKQVRPLLLVDDNALHDFKGLAERSDSSLFNSRSVGSEELVIPARVWNKLNVKAVQRLQPVKVAVDCLFHGIPTNDPNAVVVGLAPEHFNYQMMNKAFRLILQGAPLIAIHKARYYKKKDGLALGPGPFVTGLEYATDTKAIVVGKPEKAFFLEALRGIDCKPEETIMIGDDCRDDVAGAQKAGMLGVLVKTGLSHVEEGMNLSATLNVNTGLAGVQEHIILLHAAGCKYRAADEAKINPAPYLTCESFPQAVDHILQHLL